MPPTFDDVLSAADTLRGHAELTPILHSHSLDRLCGGTVFVKAEALQRTGSFKFRGAYNRLARLSGKQREAGVVAFSSGNHGLGVAEAARLLHIPAVVVMPEDAPAVKADAIRAAGAEIIFYDRLRDSREMIAGRIAGERGAVVVPNFEDPLVIAGQGTVGLEAAAQLRERGVSADLLVCPASGGGLFAGITLAFSELSPATRLYVCEPEGFDDFRASLEAGAPTRVRQGVPVSICDALMAPQPGEIAFEIVRSRAAGALRVSDREALGGVAAAFRDLRLVLEPSGAVALAALLAGKLGLNGQSALVIASGGNVDAGCFARALR